MAKNKINEIINFLAGGIADVSDGNERDARNDIQAWIKSGDVDNLKAAISEFINDAAGFEAATTLHSEYENFTENDFLRALGFEVEDLQVDAGTDKDGQTIEEVAAAVEAENAQPEVEAESATDHGTEQGNGPASVNETTMETAAGTDNPADTDNTEAVESSANANDTETAETPVDTDNADAVDAPANADGMETPVDAEGQGEQTESGSTDTAETRVEEEVKEETPVSAEDTAQDAETAENTDNNKEVTPEDNNTAETAVEEGQGTDPADQPEQTETVQETESEETAANHDTANEDVEGSNAVTGENAEGTVETEQNADPVEAAEQTETVQDAEAVEATEHETVETGQGAEPDVEAAEQTSTDTEQGTEPDVEAAEQTENPQETETKEDITNSGSATNEGTAEAADTEQGAEPDVEAAERTENSQETEAKEDTATSGSTTNEGATEAADVDQSTKADVEETEQPVTTYEEDYADEEASPRGFDMSGFGHQQEEEEYPDEVQYTRTPIDQTETANNTEVTKEMAIQFVESNLPDAKVDEFHRCMEVAATEGRPEELERFLDGFINDTVDTLPENTKDLDTFENFTSKDFMELFDIQQADPDAQEDVSAESPDDINENPTDTGTETDNDQTSDSPDAENNAFDPDKARDEAILDALEEIYKDITGSDYNPTGRSDITDSDLRTDIAQAISDKYGVDGESIVEQFDDKRGAAIEGKDIPSMSPDEFREITLNAWNEIKTETLLDGMRPELISKDDKWQNERLFQDKERGIEVQKTTKFDKDTGKIERIEIGFMKVDDHGRMRHDTDAVRTIEKPSKNPKSDTVITCLEKDEIKAVFYKKDGEITGGKVFKDGDGEYINSKTTANALFNKFTEAIPNYALSERDPVTVINIDIKDVDKLSDTDRAKTIEDILKDVAAVVDSKPDGDKIMEAFSNKLLDTLERASGASPEERDQIINDAFRSFMDMLGPDFVININDTERTDGGGGQVDNGQDRHNPGGSSDGPVDKYKAGYEKWSDKLSNAVGYHKDTRTRVCQFMKTYYAYKGHIEVNGSRVKAADVVAQGFGILNSNIIETIILEVLNFILERVDSARDARDVEREANNDIARNANADTGVDADAPGPGTDNSGINDDDIVMPGLNADFEDNDDTDIEDDVPDTGDDTPDPGVGSDDIIMPNLHADTETDDNTDNEGDTEGPETDTEEAGTDADNAQSDTDTDNNRDDADPSTTQDEENTEGAADYEQGAATNSSEGEDTVREDDTSDNTTADETPDEEQEDNVEATDTEEEAQPEVEAASDDATAEETANDGQEPDVEVVEEDNTPDVETTEEDTEVKETAEDEKEAAVEGEDAKPETEVEANDTDVKENADDKHESSADKNEEDARSDVETGKGDTEAEENARDEKESAVEKEETGSKVEEAKDDTSKEETAAEGQESAVENPENEETAQNVEAAEAGATAQETAADGQEGTVDATEEEAQPEVEATEEDTAAKETSAEEREAAVETREQNETDTGETASDTETAEKDTATEEETSDVEVTEENTEIEPETEANGAPVEEDETNAVDKESEQPDNVEADGGKDTETDGRNDGKGLKETRFDDTAKVIEAENSEAATDGKTDVDEENKIIDPDGENEAKAGQSVENEKGEESEKGEARLPEEETPLTDTDITDDLSTQEAMNENERMADTGSTPAQTAATSDSFEGKTEAEQPSDTGTEKPESELAADTGTEAEGVNGEEAENTAPGLEIVETEEIPDVDMESAVAKEEATTTEPTEAKETSVTNEDEAPDVAVSDNHTDQETTPQNEYGFGTEAAGIENMGPVPVEGASIDAVGGAIPTETGKEDDSYDVDNEDDERRSKFLTEDNAEILSNYFSADMANTSLMEMFNALGLEMDPQACIDLATQYIDNVQGGIETMPEGATVPATEELYSQILTDYFSSTGEMPSDFSLDFLETGVDQEQVLDEVSRRMEEMSVPDSVEMANLMNNPPDAVEREVTTMEVDMNNAISEITGVEEMRAALEQATAEDLERQMHDTEMTRQDMEAARNDVTGREEDPVSQTEDHRQEESEWRPEDEANNPEFAPAEIPDDVRFYDDEDNWDPVD